MLDPSKDKLMARMLAFNARAKEELELLRAFREEFPEPETQSTFVLSSLLFSPRIASKTSEAKVQTVF